MALHALYERFSSWYTDFSVAVVVLTTESLVSNDDGDGDMTTPQSKRTQELLVLQMLDDVGSYVQTGATTPKQVRTCSVLWEGCDP